MSTLSNALLLCLAGALSGSCAKKDAQDGPKTPDPAPQPTLGQSLTAPEPVLNDFDQVMGEMVLKRGARKAQNCAAAGSPPPKGTGLVDVVFDGTKGRIVDVKITESFGGASPEGLQCIRNAFVGEILPPFKGGMKVVPYSVELPGG